MELNYLKDIIILGGVKIMKDEIKNHAKEIGVDDIGFASVSNYKSPNTPHDIKTQYVCFNCIKKCHA